MGPAALSFPLQLTVRPVSFEAIQYGFLQRPFAFSSATATASAIPPPAWAADTHPPCHVILCAWSLSYLMRQQWGGDRWHTAIDHVLQHLWDTLETTPQPSGVSPSPKAALVIIETLGKGVEGPSRQSTFTERLETVWGFERHCVRTDYRFASREDAVAYTTFFFGKEIARQMAHTEAVALPKTSTTRSHHPTGNPMEDGDARNVKEGLEKSPTTEVGTPNATGVVLPEYTGIWIKWKLSHNDPPR